MRLLGDDIRKRVLEALEAMDAPVELVLVAPPSADTEEVGALLDEVAEITGKLSVVRLAPEEAAGQGLQPELTPAIYVRRAGERGARFYFAGAPAGYEFGALIEDILDVSLGRTALSDETRSFLGSLSEPVALHVFSTPT
ncbi:MAG: hypothetical protein IRZ18_09605 [Clostridia bacterium]|nr:hypothetical protein [Clostridia bacterium]